MVVSGTQIASECICVEVEDVDAHGCKSPVIMRADSRVRGISKVFRSPSRWRDHGRTRLPHEKVEKDFLKDATTMQVVNARSVVKEVQLEEL